MIKAMNNPFEKKDYKTLIAAALLGSVAAGAATYVLLTDEDAELRGELLSRFNKIKDTVFGVAQEQPGAAQQPGYLQHRQKAPKTDREALQHGEILHDHAGA